MREGVQEIMQKRTVRQLQALPLLAGMPEEVAQYLAEHGTLRRYEQRETIYRQGAPNSTAGIILSGVVDLIKREGGKKVITDICMPGDLIGNAALSGNAETIMGHAAEAWEQTSTLEIPAQDIKTLLQRHDQFQFRERMLQYVGRKLRERETHIGRLALEDSAERIVAELRDLHRRRLLDTAGVFTQERLAARVGIVRETVSRILKNLQQQGKITRQGRRISLAGETTESAN